MECAIARAFKPSLRREFAVMKSSTHQAFYEEFVSLNANNGVPCEDFSVDDLLDFSNGEFHVGNGQSTEHVDEEEEEKHSIFSSNSSNSSGVCGTNESDSIFASGLAVPTDDIEELEWVSHFVDDCAPEHSLLYPVTISEQTTKTGISSSTPGKRLSEVPKARPDLTRGLAFPSWVPVGPRSKRQRTNRSRVWSFGSYSQTDLSSFPSSCTYEFLSMPYVMLNKTVQSTDSLNQVSEPVKKRKKRLEVSQPRGSRSGGSQVQRRCTHCQVQKTPQWRAGPLGPKTLCNACGVRYKSGRLFPEYRPACSPTFSSEIHSNSHRRVTEIRKRNEMSGRPESGLNRAQMMIPSC